MATGAFAIAWNSFVAFWTISAVAGGGLLFGLFSLPFWAAGYQLAKQAFGRGFIRHGVVQSGVGVCGFFGSDTLNSQARQRRERTRAPPLTCLLPFPAPPCCHCPQEASGCQPELLATESPTK